MEKTEPPDCEPSEIYSYWANRTNPWPHLAAMARDLLNIPATSAAIERAFSVGKDVNGISRYKLLRKTVEALVCLRSWYRAELITGNDVRSFLEEKLTLSTLQENLLSVSSLLLYVRHNVTMSFTVKIGFVIFSFAMFVTFVNVPF